MTQTPPDFAEIISGSQKPRRRRGIRHGAGERQVTYKQTIGQAITGVFGELLITAGAIIALFLVWQLWWTNIAVEAFQESRQVEDTWAEGIRFEGDDTNRRYDDPPILDRDFAIGETIGHLMVPRWGADYKRTIAEGTSPSLVLDTIGIGHYESTALPGEMGNFSMAGHRPTYSKPFENIHTLEHGDAVIVETEIAWYVYRVYEDLIVLPHQNEVIAPKPGQPGVEPDKRVLTMTTCHPMFSIRERYIVHAELDYWVAKGDPPPVEPVPEA